MARAAQIDKTSLITRASRAEDAQRAADAPAALRSIPLNLAPLLTPYKKQGRLSLRIERLPRGARLSRGCRNNDGKSWSLASDELEDLTYQLPEGADAEHSLAVRIINLAGGDTLALLDFVVSPDAAGAVGADVAAAGGGESARDDTELHALRGELAAVKAALAARDGELADARQAIASTRDTDGELATARAAWSAELDERLAAAATQAAAQLQQSRDAWAAEQNARLVKSDAEAQERLAAARETWQRETQDALLKAESARTTDEAARLAAAEAQWQQKLASLQATIAERDAALVRAQDALAKAETAWKADEAARLAAAQAQWQAKASAAPAVDDRGDEIELRDLREKLTALQATLAERDAAAAQAQDALSKAETEWKADEAARFAAAEAQWQAKAMAEGPPPVVAGNEIELRGLREKLAALETAHAEATTRCEQAETALGNARVRAKEETAALRATVAKRDEELARAHSTAAPRVYDLPVASQPSRIREFVKRGAEPDTPDQKTFVWEIIVAVVLGVAGVMFYPTIEAFIFGAPPPPARTIPLPRFKPVPPVDAVVERSAVLARDAKLRAEASPKGAVVASLKSGARVVVVDERDAWVQVRAGDKTGWVKSSLVTPGAAPAPSANLPRANPPAP